MKTRFPWAVAVGSILIPLAGAPIQLQAQNGRRAHYNQPPPAQPQQSPLAQPQQSPLAQPQQLSPPPTSVAPPAADLSPATPPQVAFNGGILTITANNSTLGDILRAVHHQTGASVDVPGNATERVVGQFGPGPARDVMTSLLNGSHFNYVLLGSETNPGGLDRVVLLSKSSGGESPVEQARFSGRAQPAPPPADNADGANDDDAAADTIPDASEATDEQANPGQAQGDDQAQERQPGQPAIKTPEQLLQELQQRQQQMQQQGAPVPPQNYPPPNGGTNPQK
jgi:hypothetical protein